jgi:hypothetical protein
VSRPSLLPPPTPGSAPRTDHVVTGGYRITTGLSDSSEGVCSADARGSLDRIECTGPARREGVTEGETCPHGC